jgi:hypothetical protein
MDDYQNIADPGMGGESADAARQHRHAADWAILLGTAHFACCPGTPARSDNQGGDTHKTVLRGGLTL